MSISNHWASTPAIETFYILELSILLFQEKIIIYFIKWSCNDKKRHNTWFNTFITLNLKNEQHWLCKRLISIIIKHFASIKSWLLHFSLIQSIKRHEWTWQKSKLRSLYIEKHTGVDLIEHFILKFILYDQ